MQETAGTVTDWYDGQTLGLTNATVFWKEIAPKPTTSQYVSDRNGKNDGMHVVIVDDTGSVTGIKGNILEKNTFLSKAATQFLPSPLLREHSIKIILHKVQDMFTQEETFLLQETVST